MAASDYVPIFFKNRLHLAGRPQMSTRFRHSGATRTASNPEIQRLRREIPDFPARDAEQIPFGKPSDCR
jgi:hypothetical protein